MARGPTPAVWALLVLAVAAIAPGGLFAADQPLSIGRSIVVVSDVKGGIGDTPPRQIVVNDDVVFQEDILTGDEAKTVIEFRDGSTFEVGPGSVVRIDSFVFNPDESISRKAVEVGRGVFRYVSGLAAADQDTRISTASGTLAIRGSVVAGIVEPDVPDFVYVGEGHAVFTNDAGSTAMEGGGAIAVPSRTTTPVRPTAMPAAVVAQALEAINRRLPAAELLRHRPPASPAWLRQAGAANLLPAAEQAKREAAATRGRPLVAPGSPPRVAREVNLLIEGNRHNLFDGAQTRRTPEQQAFLAQAARAVPRADAVIARSTRQAAAAHRTATLAAAGTVMRGIAAAAPSPEVLGRVATAAAKANPSAASAIRQTSAAVPHAPASRGQVREVGPAQPAGAASRDANRKPTAAQSRRQPPREAHSTTRRPPSPLRQQSVAGQPRAPHRERTPVAAGPPQRAGPPRRGAEAPERAGRGPRPAQTGRDQRRERRPEDQSPR